MFSVSPIEPIVSLDDAPVSQTDYQCTSAEVCVIEDVVSVQDVALTSKNITTSSVSNRDAMFGALGASETLKENSYLAERFTNASEVVVNLRRVDRMELANFMERVQVYVATDPTAFGEFPEAREFVSQCFYKAMARYN